MKKILYSIFALGSIFFYASCAPETDPYKPAPVPDGDQVYFPSTIITDYDLSAETETEVTIDLPLLRVKDASALEVNISSEIDGQEEAVSVAAVASFTAGSNETVVPVKVDVPGFEQDSTCVITLTIADEASTTPYGASKVTITITNPKPAEWIKFDKGVMVEAGWGEKEEGKEMYYKAFRGSIVECKVPDCFGYEAHAAGEEYDVQDYVFYWDQETNVCYVPPFFMGYVEDGVDYYCSDAAGFYSLYYGWYTLDDFMSEEYAAWAPAWMAKNGFTVPSYDGNGCFYLGDWLYEVADGAATGYGIQFGGAQDTFTGGSFNRTTNYNKDISWTNAAFGTLDSEAWKVKGVDIVLAKGEDPDFDEETPSDLFYIRDYFSKGSGLAFKVVASDDTPEATYAIEDGVNVQYTGYEVFGKEVGANIVARKSTISGPIDGNFPVEINLCVNLDLYEVGTDEEGKPTYTKVYALGEFNEVITLTSAAWYNIDQLYGLNKEYYVGDFIATALDLSEGQVMSWPMSIEDGGEDEGVSWLVFKNFAPFAPQYVPDNRFYVEWYGGDGLLYFLNGTPCEGTFEYGGESYPLFSLLLDSESEAFDEEEGDYLVAGYYFNEATEYESIPFVNYPYNIGLSNADGLAFTAYEFGDLAYLAQFELFFDEGEADSAASSARACTAAGPAPAKREGLTSARWEVKTLSRVMALKEASAKMHKALGLQTTAAPSLNRRFDVADFHKAGVEINASNMAKIEKVKAEKVKFNADRSIRK